MILSKFKTVARDELKLTEVGSILSQYITNHGRGELFSTKFLKTRLKLGIMRLRNNEAVSLSVSRKRSTDCQKTWVKIQLNTLEAISRCTLFPSN